MAVRSQTAGARAGRGFTGGASLSRLAAVAGPGLAVFIVTRFALALLAWKSQIILPAPHHHPNASVLPVSDTLARLGSWASPWFRFDTAWYVHLAQHGYHYGALGKANTNFMPLYPFLTALLTPLTAGSAWIASWLVANAACAASFALYWYWARRRCGEGPAIRALLLLAAFPFGFFLSTPYAEPVFLALALGAFLLAENDRWYEATAVAGLAALTRPVGLAVVLGLAVMALERGKRREAMISTLGIAPLALFAGYLGVAFHHPLAFLTYHSAGWVTPHGGLWTTIASQFDTNLSPFDRVDAFLAALFLVSAVLVWRRFGKGYAVYTAVGVLLPLAHGLVSMERYVVVLFPVMAAWSTIENKLVQISIFTISLLALILGSVLFFSGYAIF